MPVPLSRLPQVSRSKRNFYLDRKSYESIRLHNTTPAIMSLCTELLYALQLGTNCCNAPGIEGCLPCVFHRSLCRSDLPVIPCLLEAEKICLASSVPQKRMITRASPSASSCRRPKYFSVSPPRGRICAAIRLYLVTGQKTSINFDKVLHAAQVHTAY